MVFYIVDEVKKLNPNKIVLVVQKDRIPKINGVEFAFQKFPKGTGDALLSAESIVDCKEDILVLPGDVPLITSSTLSSLSNFHRGNHCTILTTVLSDPSPYGRIVKDGEEVVRIVEERDATDVEKKIKEINTGIYMFNVSSVFEFLKEVRPENSQNEYYLTDVIGILKNKGYRIGSFISQDKNEVIGINDRAVLSYVSEILQKRIIMKHQIGGVTILPPVEIDYDVRIGKDTIIKPFTSIYGNTSIGKKCRIGPNTVIINSTVPSGTTVEPFTKMGC